MAHDECFSIFFFQGILARPMQYRAQSKPWPKILLCSFIFRLSFSFLFFPLHKRSSSTSGQHNKNAFHVTIFPGTISDSEIVADDVFVTDATVPITKGFFIYRTTKTSGLIYITSSSLILSGVHQEIWPLSVADYCNIFNV